MNTKELTRAAGRCIHFNGIQNKTCKAGCAYPRPVAGCCFPSFVDGLMANPHPCPSYTATGMEAAKKQEEETNQFIQNVDTARAAIVANIEATGKTQDAIPCPVCKNGSLRYRRASCNGHIHAQCMTPDCVAWME